MKSTFRKHIGRFLGDQRAPSAIEYALLVAGVAVLIIAIVYTLGGGAKSALEAASPVPPGNTTSTTPP